MTSPTPANLRIVKAESYRRDAKRWRNADKDVDAALAEVPFDPGDPIFFKVVYKKRVQNSANNRGKSKGFRLISHVSPDEPTVTLLRLYDHTQMDNILEKEIKALLTEAALPIPQPPDFKNPKGR